MSDEKRVDRPQGKIGTKAGTWRIICAAAVIATLAGPAYGQISGQNKTPGPPPAPPKSQQEIEAERAAERAYKNSLRAIPDQPPADPWGNARSLEAPKAAAKAKPATKSGGN
jgi:hypothetical protein